LETQQADVLLVLDCSTQDGEGNFVREVGFATSYLNQFSISPDRMQFAALTYASLPNAEFWFNSYHDRRQMVFALQTLRYSQGSANLAGAFRVRLDQPRLGLVTLWNLSVLMDGVGVCYQPCAIISLSSKFEYKKILRTS
jgi:hypothetical protein